MKKKKNYDLQFLKVLQIVGGKVPFLLLLKISSQLNWKLEELEGFSNLEQSLYPVTLPFYLARTRRTLEPSSVLDTLDIVGRDLKLTTNAPRDVCAVTKTGSFA